MQPGRLRSLPLPVIMQKFLSDLLIFSALSLCALCAFQHAEAKRTAR